MGVSPVMRMDKIKSLLLVNHHGIGDNVMMTPSVRALKLANPHLEISVLVSSEYSAISELWKTNPYVKRVITSKISFHPKFWNPLAFYLKEYWPIRQEYKEVQAAYSIQKVKLVRCQYLPELIENKVLFFLLPTHRVDRIAFELGLKLVDYKYDVSFDNHHKEKAIRFLKGSGMDKVPLLVGLHTVSTAGERTWDLSKVRVVVETLNNKYGAKFILFHDKKSFDLERKLSDERLDNRLVACTCDGQNSLDILTTSALVSMCNVMICVDSALAHIANAVNTPLVLLCDPKNPIKTRIPKSGVAIGANTVDFSPALVLDLFETAVNSFVKL